MEGCWFWSGGSEWMVADMLREGVRRGSDDEMGVVGSVGVLDWLGGVR